MPWARRLRARRAMAALDRGDHARLAGGAEVFGGIKAECGGVSKRAGGNALPLRSKGLRGIFDQQTVAGRCNGGQGGPVGALAVEMDGQDGADGGMLLKAERPRLRVEVAGAGIDVRQDGYGAQPEDGAGGGEEGEGGGQDAVARAARRRRPSPARVRRFRSRTRWLRWRRSGRAAACSKDATSGPRTKRWLRKTASTAAMISGPISAYSRARSSRGTRGARGSGGRRGWLRRGNVVHRGHPDEAYRNPGYVFCIRHSCLTGVYRMPFAGDPAGTDFLMAMSHCPAPSQRRFILQALHGIA